MEKASSRDLHPKKAQRVSPSLPGGEHRQETGCPGMLHPRISDSTRSLPPPPGPSLYPSLLPTDSFKNHIPGCFSHPSPRSHGGGGVRTGPTHPGCT